MERTFSFPPFFVTCHLDFIRARSVTKVEVVHRNTFYKKQLLTNFLLTLQFIRRQYLQAELNEPFHLYLTKFINLFYSRMT